MSIHRLEQRLRATLLTHQDHLEQWVADFGEDEVALKYRDNIQRIKLELCLLKTVLMETES
jgi:hypothetical protein